MIRQVVCVTDAQNCMRNLCVKLFAQMMHQVVCINDASNRRMLTAIDDVIVEFASPHKYNTSQTYLIEHDEAGNIS